MTHDLNCCTEHCDRKQEVSVIDLWALLWGAVFSAPLWFLLFLLLLKSHGV
jgi:hypothetical protein